MLSPSFDISHVNIPFRNLENTSFKVVLFRVLFFFLSYWVCLLPVVVLVK